MHNLTSEKLKKHFLKNGVHPHVIQHLEQGGFFHKLIEGIGTTAKFLLKHKDTIKKGIQTGIEVYKTGKDIYDSLKGGIVAQRDPHGNIIPSRNGIFSNDYYPTRPEKSQQDILDIVKKRLRKSKAEPTVSGGKMSAGMMAAPAPPPVFKKKTKLPEVKYFDAHKDFKNSQTILNHLPADLEELYIDNAPFLIMQFLTNEVVADHLPATLHTIWLRGADHPAGQSRRSPHPFHIDVSIESNLSKGFPRLPVNTEIILDQGNYNAMGNWIPSVPLVILREEDFRGKGLSKKGGMLSAGAMPSAGKLSSKMRHRADFLSEHMKGKKMTMAQAQQLYEKTYPQYCKTKASAKKSSTHKRVKIQL